MVDGNSVEWPSFGTVAISSKLADKNNIKAGDSIVFSYGIMGRQLRFKWLMYLIITFPLCDNE